MRRVSTLLLLGGASLVMAGWSTPNLFPESVAAGGGDGRFFTGSSRDAFGCDVCHAGADSPHVEITGLPQRYVAGETYTLEVRWPANDDPVSLLGEFVDEQGDGVGSVTLPPMDIIVDEERCASGTVALDVIDAEHDRSIFGMPACGASLTRLQWTAPDALAGQVYLHLGLVQSDASDDPDGDGVTMIVRTLESDDTEAGCATGRPSASALVWLFPLLLRRRR